MKLLDYPMCCKAKVLCGFGGGHLAEDDRVVRADGAELVERHTKEEIKEFLDERIPRLRNYGLQVIFACPTSHQPEAIEALQEYGFYGARKKDLKDINCVTYNYRKAGRIDHYMVPMFLLLENVSKNRR